MPPYSAQEKALVDRGVAGDEEAWWQLHRRYGQLLRLLAARALRQARMASTKEAVQDLVQDVLCGLLIHEHQQLAKYDLERAGLGRFLGLRVLDAVYDRSNQVGVRDRLEHERRWVRDLAGQQDGPDLLDCVVEEILARLTEEEACVAGGRGKCWHCCTSSKAAGPRPRRCGKRYWPSAPISDQPGRGWTNWPAAPWSAQLADS